MSRPPNLPQGWEITSIAQVTHDRVNQSEPIGKNNFRYIDIASINNQEKRISEPKSLPVAKAPSRARQVVQTDDVLVSMTRPNLNAVAIVPAQLNGATASTGFDVLRANGAVAPMWLFLLVRSKGFVDAMTALVQGALYPAVRPADVRNFRFPQPPLAEQRRILARLEKLEARSRRARQVLDAIPARLSQARQSLLAAAFRGTLTKDWRKSPSALRKTDPARNNGLRAKPTAWRRIAFGDLMENSFYGPRFDAKSYCQEGVPTIRTTDMSFDGAIVLKDPPRLKLSPRDLEKFGLRGGDLVVTRTGATIGKCAVYSDTLGPAIPGAYLIRFRLKHEEINPKYALLFLMSPVGQRLLVSGSTATAQPNVNATTIAKFEIPVAPLDEQREIVRRLQSAFSRLDAAAAAHAEALAELDRLDQSLLTQAFRGRLVPQDPSDEPAAALLQRIKAARQAASPHGGGNRRIAQQVTSENAGCQKGA